VNDRRDGIVHGADQQPRACKHCGRVPADSITIGTDQYGQRVIACIPVCPPRDDDQEPVR